MKTLRALICLLGCLFPALPLFPSRQLGDYGVFLGIDAGQLSRTDGYRLVVIDPSEFLAQDIARMHQDGKTVYGYLNIGSIEAYRPFYDRFKQLSLAPYENWPDERWVDVSASTWQDFLTDELGRQYVDKGIDGFFLDNADVYDHYPTEETFQGLCTILKGLKQYHLPLVINGGDTFVRTCMREGIARSMIDGINQESVFTSVDVAKGTYGNQPPSISAYFQEYLSAAKECGLYVYLVEYRASKALARQIDAYCAKNGFLWYNAKGIELR
ncbi:MAG: endo alpha-1,4 polygalactosaminidase [Sphaerochaetaceae bacterium]|nr:endo alpha-1,4 polygalactosaminidase [Spirochaetales bacterium]MDY5500353.1 endo alpha-1,4 polygalactosaminidase [Sphaerochaetaceae bacterium]